jgi:hypothetical protein
MLRLYPAPFRTRFADEMVMLFGDQLRDARSGAGPGVLRTWLRTIVDLAVTAPAEHTARQQVVARSLTLRPTVWSRLIGGLGIVGGLLLVMPYVPVLGSVEAVQPWRVWLFFLASIVIVIAVHRRQAPVAPRLARAAAVPAVVANAAMISLPVLEAVLRPERTGVNGDFGLAWFWISEAVFLADAWFGFVSRRLGVVTPWGAGIVALGSLFVMLGNDRLGLVDGSLGNLISSIAQAGIVIAGVGWVWLGFDLAVRRRPSTTPTASTAL